MRWRLRPTHALPSSLRLWQGPVVEDEEQLPARVLDDVLEELEERIAIKHGGELVVEARSRFDRDCTEDMRGLAHAKGVNVWLNSDAGPGAMQAAIEPEARFVAEHHEPAARERFFLMAGNVLRNQKACAATSARASRFRGRCKENPSSCSSRGTLY